MKKIAYKLLIGFVFSVFGILTKWMFSTNDLPIKQLFLEEDFWINYIIFFGIGYILLGNMFWANAQKKKVNKD